MFSGGAVKSIEEKTEYQRIPAKGWDRLDIVDSVAQVKYDLPKGAAFSRIVINSNMNGNFELIFQKPKEPVAFEKLLTKFGCQFDSLEKNFNHFMTVVSEKDLAKIFQAIKEEKYVSDLLFQDMTKAVAPDNYSLKEHRAERQKQEEARKFKGITYSYNN